jgi:hypothetical protein
MDLLRAGLKSFASRRGCESHAHENCPFFLNISSLPEVGRHGEKRSNKNTLPQNNAHVSGKLN